MGTVTTYGPGGFDPAKPNNNIIETVVVPDPVVTGTALNRNTLEAKATQAIADNIAFSATVATNRQRIINATTAATNGTTATITTVGQAQAAIRSIASTLVTTLNAELAIADQAAALSAQNVALLRLMLGALDSTDGT